MNLSLERTPISAVVRIPLPGIDLRSTARALRASAAGELGIVPEGPAGTGLSLIVCRALLVRMGGTLEIEAGAEHSDLLIEMPVVP